MPNSVVSCSFGGRRSFAKPDCPADNPNESMTPAIAILKKHQNAPEPPRRIMVRSYRQTGDWSIAKYRCRTTLVAHAIYGTVHTKLPNGTVLR